MQRVLDDPSFRIAAARLGAQVRAEADSGAALAELEALVPRVRGPAPHLRRALTCPMRRAR